MSMSNETRLKMQNNIVAVDCDPSAVCVIHDFVKITFLKIFRTCSICKVYKAWPWVTMVKCKKCKMIGHRRCLQKRKIKNKKACGSEYVERILETTHTTEQHMLLQQSSFEQQLFDNEDKCGGEVEPINGANEENNTGPSPVKETEKCEKCSDVGKPLSTQINVTDLAYFHDNTWYMIAKIVKDDDEFFVVTKSCFDDEEIVARTIFLRIVTDVAAVLIQIWQRPFVYRIQVGRQ